MSLEIMKREIIILANSWRPGGRCIAGICKETKEWIRPLYDNGDEFIPKDQVNHINLLESVTIDLLKHLNDPYQPENWFIEKPYGNWESKTDDILGNMNIVKSMCETDAQILHSDIDRVHEDEITDRKSLILIQKDVEFIKYKKDGKDKWYGSFLDGNGNKLELSLTDPIFHKALDENPNLRNGNYMLAVSLTKPYKDTLCYKLIAGVIY